VEGEALAEAVECQRKKQEDAEAQPREYKALRQHYGGAWVIMKRDQES
jgi:hypothetical protein